MKTTELVLSEEEVSVFMQYLIDIYAGVKGAYNLLNNNFLTRLLARKSTLHTYECIIETSDKLITVLKNGEGLTIKTYEDFTALYYLTDTKFLKLTLFIYKKSVDIDYYNKAIRYMKIEMEKSSGATCALWSAITGNSCGVRAGGR